MSVTYYGDFAEDDTVNMPFNTFSSDDPSASVTITNLADADIKVHKDGSTDEISTDGATVVINFDSRTGAHMVTIDTSADSAYATGSEYAVLIEGTTIDGGTITAWIGTFSIERAGGALALVKAQNNLSAANILTQVNIALDAAISELGVTAPTATPSIRTGIMLGYMAILNKRDTTASSDEIHNNAGTVIASGSLTEDGVTFSKAKYT